MKAYIIYIATLLAALALPATAQNGGTGTKAAPDNPAMPYKLTTVTISGNNGTVEVKDAKEGGNGIITVENDTLVYGATGNNATTVKLAVTPNTGYTIRKGYPKAYKTGNSSSTITVTESKFAMPASPVTVEIAYAHQLDSIADITLKENKQTADEVIAILPRYVHIILAGGRKDSLPVSKWTYEASKNNGSNDAHNNGGSNGEYNATDGAVNVFTFTLEALPDSIDANGKLTDSSDGGYTGTAQVANMALPLVPTETDKGITISGGTGDNLNSNTDGNSAPKPFDGTIGNGTGTEVKSIKIDATVQDGTITLKGVTVSGSGTSGSTDAKTEVVAGASVTIKVEGTNNLGNLTVASGGTLILDKADGASLETTSVTNSGTLIDSTATLTKVTGDGALEIDANLSGGGSVTPNTAVTLTSTVNDRAGTTYFIWQQKQADGSYTDITTNEYNDQGEIQTKTTGTGIIDTYQPATTSVGKAEYRCLVKRVKTISGGGTATTLLSTKSATVEVKSGGNPTPPVPVPTYYTVTLPAVEGFTTKPAAGNHTVEEGYNFSFSLTLPEGYTGDAPTVTTSRGETLTPRESDGKYVIRDVTENITVEIAGIPTANAEMTADDIRIECHAGSVHIHTPNPVATAIYTLTGHRFRQLSLPAGDNRIRLPQGAYIVVAGDKRQKLVVR